MYVLLIYCLNYIIIKTEKFLNFLIKKKFKINK